MCQSSHPVSRRHLLAGLGALALAPTLARPARAAADRIDLPDPTLEDACPVCGMLPARYPAWIATVLYGDGLAHHFDGAKDMFKYLLDMPKYAGGRTAEGIEAIGVTEYYDLVRIDARSALYVTGSDVLGPMGHELVPFRGEADAGAFMEDHGGAHTLGFDAVTFPLLTALDEGRFIAG